MGGQFADLVLVLIKRMAGHPEPEQLFFAGQLVFYGPVGNVGERRVVRFRAAHQLAEQAGLPAFAVAVGALARFHGAFHGGELLRARPFQRIHRAGADQALDHAPVHGAQVDRFGELVDGAEAAQLLARAADGLDRGLAQVLHRAQPEADADPPVPSRPA